MGGAEKLSPSARPKLSRGAGGVVRLDRNMTRYFPHHFYCGRQTIAGPLSGIYKIINNSSSVQELFILQSVPLQEEGDDFPT